MSHHLITFSDVCFSYPDGTQVLKGVSFQIHHGEKVALVGANGAGKSTLINLLSGFYQPSSGYIALGDIKVTPATIETVRRTIGFTFQNPDDQLFMPTVFDDVAFGLVNMGVEGEDLERQVMSALRRVGVEHLAERPPYRLSGGQKRSVALAGILVMEPSVLVLDEPSNALDPQARENLLEQLTAFTHSQLIATHDLDLVLDICDRVIVLSQGEVLSNATPAETFSNLELLQASSLGLPLKMQGKKI
ncbi:energy-coupling factor ABC transporter ATP-binding protein [Psychrobacter sp. I-STPA6b]|uniref:energy-coupling factor ABC transporter ATP-binding protein n=1 Tax=Psychrobacter sp. I-STPA6b TaxID=2585718 RepID=UPI001D0C7A61|nr:ABC transporter ATP-binding protein [Psychrobacter sp. I-STPA6b]